ncbi:MAG: phosphoethanolamine--lipid A transferase [Alphaproteobacteria bacterium]|nr:phosphoethanolamine--lipid A transferase [Alphaproteobacteria bacterium]
MKKPAIKSHLFIILMTFYFGFCLNLAFWRYIHENLAVTNTQTALFAVSLVFFILIPLYVFFNLVVVPFFAKTLTVILLLISSAANYWMVHYGIFIDPDMVRNVFETNRREALDLITWSFLFWFGLTGVIPALLVVLADITYQSFGKELKKRFVLIVISLVVFGALAGVFYKEYAAFGRHHKHARALINTANYIHATTRYIRAKTQVPKTFETIDQTAVVVSFEDQHKTVLVLALGEAARPHNFSLYGYKRDTNPLLAQQDIIRFRDVSACGTTTAISVPCIFSHKPRKDFDVDDARYTENLLDILKTAGNDIIWLENDDGCKGVCARVYTEDMVKVNDPRYCKGSYCHDEALLDRLEDILNNIKTDTLIVLHMMGSHGPTYYNRYPDRFKVFQPTCDTGNLQNCTRNAIINTYDNTILYTDFVLSSIIDILKKHPDYETGLLYVSDHGESLGENNIYLHGLPYKIAPQEQIKIPMILWMSDTMKENDHIDEDCLKQEAEKHAYTHDNLFHSIVSLFEIKTKVYNPTLDLFKTCRTKALLF